MGDRSFDDVKKEYAERSARVIAAGQACEAAREALAAARKALDESARAFEHERSGIFELEQEMLSAIRREYAP